MKIDVTVTPKNIHEGHRNSCCSCPVALAIKPEFVPGPRTFPEITDVSVHLTDGHFTLQKEQTGPKFVYKFPLPPKAQQFVIEYQGGATPRPYLILYRSNGSLREASHKINSMNKPATVLELFEGHPERWTQGTFARDRNGCDIDPESTGAATWCLSGAMKLVYEYETREFDDAYSRASKLIDGNRCCAFNDEHTFKEVLEIVRQAGI